MRGRSNTQSVKTVESGGPRGWDAAKRLKGRKRHIAVETDGLLLGVVVHAANSSCCSPCEAQGHLGSADKPLTGAQRPRRLGHHQPASPRGCGGPYGGASPPAHPPSSLSSLTYSSFVLLISSSLSNLSIIVKSDARQVPMHDAPRFPHRSLYSLCLHSTRHAPHTQMRPASSLHLYLVPLIKSMNRAIFFSGYDNFFQGSFAKMIHFLQSSPSAFFFSAEGIFFGQMRKPETNRIFLLI